MSMAYDDNWTNLPGDLLHQIMHKLSVLRDCFGLTLVCKSWRDSLSGYEKPCLPLTGYPFLLLAEEVAPGVIVSDGEYDSNEDYGDDEEEHSDDDDDQEEEEYNDDDVDDNITDKEEHSGKDDDQEEEYDDDDNITDKEEHSGKDDDDEEYQIEEDDDEDKEETYDHSKKSVGSSRGLYSLLTGNTYVMDLPEAAGRLILGTNIGWLVTLGTDLKINLLHPLLRHQIPLPPMLTIPCQPDFNENYRPEDASENYIEKVAISTKILNKNTVVGLSQHHVTPSPVVMALYGGLGVLGFARLGDKVWTDVNIPSSSFHDIVYHNGNFYVVDCHGGVFVCGVDNDKERRDLRGKEIAKLETDDWDQKYLVELSSGSGLLLLVRYRKDKFFKLALRRRPKYRTTGFSVWRLDLKYSDSLENISCSLKEERHLGNNAIFVGRNSSVSICSSDFIKSNSIYYTDDYLDCYFRHGGGHDMGIFDMKRSTIEPHYTGKSIHPISPPLWYI